MICINFSFICFYLTQFNSAKNALRFEFMVEQINSKVKSFLFAFKIKFIPKKKFLAVDFISEISF